MAKTIGTPLLKWKRSQWLLLGVFGFTWGDREDHFKCTQWLQSSHGDYLYISSSSGKFYFKQNKTMERYQEKEKPL